MSNRIKRKINKKTSLFFIVGLILVGLGGTLAYYNSSTSFDNVFETVEYKTIAEEVFESPTNWKPGETIPKTITVTNEGDINVNVRVCISDSWETGNGDTISNYDSTLGENIALINSANTSDWTYVEGCYFYNNELEPNETTSTPIESVTFNPNYQGDVTCTTVNNTITCESGKDSYDGATYTLKLTADTIQSEGMEEWNYGYSLDGVHYNYSSPSQIAQETGYDNYLRNVPLQSGTMKQAGFILNNEEVYLTGGDSGTSYSDNVALLEDAFPSGSCTDNTNNYECSTNDYLVVVSNDGEVAVSNFSENGEFFCYIDDEGNKCVEYKNPSYYLDMDEALSGNTYDTFEDVYDVSEHNVYFKNELNGNKWTYYIGAKIGNTHYLLTMYDATKYNENKEILNTAFGSSNCTDNTTSYSCTNSDFKASIHNDGYVQIIEKTHPIYGCESSGGGCNYISY